MIKAHKIRLYPNNKQETYFRNACGVKRFAYNWALSESRRLYEEGVKTSGYDLSKRLNAIKREEFPWMYDVSKWASQKAVHDAFESLKKWWNPKLGNQAPRFKKKGKCKDSFYLGSSHIKERGDRFYIPKLGWVKMAQELRFEGKILSATVSRVADMWFVSISIDTLINPIPSDSPNIIGIDVGIKSLAITSDGEVFENPKALKKNEKRLRLLQKSVSRKKKGSNNRKKAVFKLAKQHYKVSNIRKDALHKASTAITKSAGTICIEDLNVSGMLRNRKLSKSISDASMSEFLRQIEYKSKWNGSIVFKADRFYPSSKMCSCCGTIKHDLKLSDRVYKCSSCGLELDRDLNAAINLKQLAVSYTESINACGDVSSGSNFIGVKLLSMKQEKGRYV